MPPVNEPRKLDLSALREMLAREHAPGQWRSLDELAEDPEERRDMAGDEFPSRSDDVKGDTTRRDLFRIIGGAVTLAATAACTKQPREAIIPYVRQPEEVLPGRPLFFATAMPFRGTGVGLLVESREGRPIKVEGNPQHPGSLGRTMPWHQASIFDLYDPDRSQAVTYRGRISSWGEFLGAMAELRDSSGRGEGLHVLTASIDSPTLIAQRAELQGKFPDMQWYHYSPDTSAASEGARAAFGEPANPICLIERADTIVSLDADFLYSTPSNIPYARAFISRRHAEADRSGMNRLYVFEPTPTPTGAKADHRIPVRATEVESIARALAATIGVATTNSRRPLTPELQRWVDIVARDLQEHKGTSLVIPGDWQPPAVHVLAHAMNRALGNDGTTVVYTHVSNPAPMTDMQSIRSLADAIRAGRVKALFIIDRNPVYDAPADLDFVKLLQAVPLRVHAGLHQDETGVLCHWHVPLSHYLESWSDTAAFDGTVSIVQPLIAPLYDTRTAHEILNTLTDRPSRNSYDTVREFWQAQYGADAFEEFWQESLHNGFVRGTALAQRAAAPAVQAVPPPAANEGSAGQPLEIVFRPDPCVWDGRFSNNTFLQELPKPHTTITWDNTAYVSVRTAERLDLQNGHLVELHYRGRSVRAPVWITPGQADDSVTVFFGYGRYHGGRNANDRGFNAYALRTSDAPYFGSGLEIRKLNERYPIAVTQGHHRMEGRDLVRWASNGQFLSNPDLFRTHVDPVSTSLYPEWRYEGYRWGMSIDLTACIGCNACVVACMTENNVPVVGKDQVMRSREMHWLRIDHYQEGDLDNPVNHFQPVLCMHCEKAPCEPVCPVAATLHSDDGLSQMIYNRCVGTRYCSNNCPYKVRRFNFLLYQDWDTPSIAAMRNPEVTVRSRGVMEKCSFCIQRIQAAKIESERENRRIRDGEVVTACQGACPTDAIIFGDLNDKTSRAARLKHSALAYDLLAELGTQPRVSYLAELRNPHPTLEPQRRKEERH